MGIRQAERPTVGCVDGQGVNVKTLPLPKWRSVTSWQSATGWSPLGGRGRRGSIPSTCPVSDSAYEHRAHQKVRQAGLASHLRPRHKPNGISHGDDGGMEKVVALELRDRLFPRPIRRDCCGLVNAQNLFVSARGGSWAGAESSAVSRSERLYLWHSLRQNAAARAEHDFSMPRRGIRDDASSERGDPRKPFPPPHSLSPAHDLLTDRSDVDFAATEITNGGARLVGNQSGRAR